MSVFFNSRFRDLSQLPEGESSDPSNHALLRPDCVLVDDDSLIHLMWKVAASERGKDVLFFSSITELFAITPALDRNTPIYVDANLGNGVRGEDVVAVLVQTGFRSVFLATGYTSEDLGALPANVQVVGKEPPWKN